MLVIVIILPETVTQEREILMSSWQEYQSDARDKDKTTTARRIRGLSPGFYWDDTDGNKTTYQAK